MSVTRRKFLRGATAATEHGTPGTYNGLGGAP